MYVNVCVCLCVCVSSYERFDEHILELDPFVYGWQGASVNACVCDFVCVCVCVCVSYSVVHPTLCEVYAFLSPESTT